METNLIRKAIFREMKIPTAQLKDHSIVAQMMRVAVAAQAQMKMILIKVALQIPVSVNLHLLYLNKFYGYIHY